MLGEERAGDRVAIDGSAEANRLVASALTVLDGATTPDASLVGEIVRRTENILQVIADGKTDQITVEVPETATVDIPAIPGENNVTQLRHRLDVQRMSKSKENVVNPDDLVERYGADTLRTYLMFAFEWEKGGPWDSRGIKGAHRFIIDVWRLGEADYEPANIDNAASADLRRAAHQAVTKVGKDLESFRWNTAVAELMKLRNAMNDALGAGNVSGEAWREALGFLALLLAPIAPHVSDEVWHTLGNEESVHLADWPTADESVSADDVVTMVVQVNGKVRARFEVSVDISEGEAIDLAKSAENVAKYLEGNEIRKVIARPPNLVNIVV